MIMCFIAVPMDVSTSVHSPSTSVRSPGYSSGEQTGNKLLTKSLFSSKR